MPYLATTSSLISLLSTIVTAQTRYTIPPTTPSSNTSLILNKACLGISFEFFAYPAWQALASTATCLNNLGSLSEALPPIRIGGTTQDRALYNPVLETPVNYTVATPLDAPLHLTYGPSFFQLASTYSGNITIGLNRELAQLNNTIAAAEKAISIIPSLYAMELGNEPDLYGASSPIAQTEENGVWTPQTDADSQTHWQSSLSLATNRTSLIQAGVRLQPQKGWSISQLSPVEVTSGSLPFVKSFGEHSYPQSACGGAATNLSLLMSHQGIVSYTSRFRADAAAAHSANRPFFLSETNSATCGGGGISSTFGAALWVLDYSLQALVAGAQALNFHHGTLGNSPYDWWGQLYNSTTNALTPYTFAPYYGAVFAAAAIAGAEKVGMLDDGSSEYAVYGVYGRDGALMRAVLYNSVYFNDSVANSSRGNHTFRLSGLQSSGFANAVRLTSGAASDKVEMGQVPTVAGLSFRNEGCQVRGVPKVERVRIWKGAASVSVRDSEAVLLDFTGRGGQGEGWESGGGHRWGGQGGWGKPGGLGSWW